MAPDIPWSLQNPGSAQTMVNYWPLANRLVPRSRLSSWNTIRAPGPDGIRGIYPLVRDSNVDPTIWISGATVQSVVLSGGSISQASFTSADGLGISGLPSHLGWQYCPAYIGPAGTNVVLAAGWSSHNTILCLHQVGSGGTLQPTFSYLTDAPRTRVVAQHDSYYIAWGTVEGGIAAATRLRWSERGDATSWTPGNGTAGFEDLLDARGMPTRAVSLPDGRLILFTTLEIWYGVTTPQAAAGQFLFQPLERSVGCNTPFTVQECDLGILFVGSDNAVRLLPLHGGASRVLVPSLTEVLRRRHYVPKLNQVSHAAFDSTTRLYNVFFQKDVSGAADGFFAVVINIDTGEWGYTDYNDSYPRCSAPMPATYIDTFPGVEGMVFGNSNGTFYSSNSKIQLENGSAVTSLWRSNPLAPDQPMNYKQVVQVDLDYQATSKSTVTVSISQDGGNTYETPGHLMSLPVVNVAGRATSQMYLGGGLVSVELKSQSTGYELHRVDTTLKIGGRR